MASAVTRATAASCSVSVATAQPLLVRLCAAPRWLSAREHERRTELRARAQCPAGRRRRGGTPPGLQGFEQQLRAIGISSAWEPLLGLYVGVVAMRPAGVDRVVGLLVRNAAGRLGVSPPYDVARQLDLASSLPEPRCQ